MSDWNSSQYLKFKKERTQPAIDLANRITSNSVDKILDIGCGPGNSTQILADKFPNAYILGIDSSADMIATAQAKYLSKYPPQYPQIDFKLVDVTKDFASEFKINTQNDFDVVFSNACIHWIPNHSKLLKEIFAVLKIGGTLAVQIPITSKSIFHQIVGKLANSPQWHNKFSTPHQFYSLSDIEYFDILADIASEFSIWETVYYHNISSHQDIIEWYRGSGLRPYLDALSADEQIVFEKEILEQLVSQYAKQANGSIVFKFHRLFFTAIK